LLKKIMLTRFSRASFRNSQIRSIQSKRFGVIGAGQMGSGIALVAAAVAKYDVVMVDSQQESLNKAGLYFDSTLSKMVQKQKLTEVEAKEAKNRIRPTLNIKDLGDRDFIVEAVSENTDLKLKIFDELCKITPPTTILATNTSSISITKVAQSTNHPDKVIGMHFMNPVPVMTLVEVINGLQTSVNTFVDTLSILKEMQKVHVVSKDSPGFIINRILMPMINEAIQTLHEGIASVADINTGMKLGCNMPMGPLELAEFIGLDTCLSIMQVLHKEFGDSKYRPSPLLVKMCEAGWFGKKNGLGFEKLQKLHTV